MTIKISNIPDSVYARALNLMFGTENKYQDTTQWTAKFQYEYLSEQRGFTAGELEQAIVEEMAENGWTTGEVEMTSQISIDIKASDALRDFESESINNGNIWSKKQILLGELYWGKTREDKVRLFLEGHDKPVMGLPLTIRVIIAKDLGLT
jgi:hypothetical protein